ncbi:MAG: hypothetical protein ABIU05_21780, partial [Nitrospirales bacterium]
ESFAIVADTVSITLSITSDPGINACFRGNSEHILRAKGRDERSPLPPTEKAQLKMHPNCKFSSRA